MRNPDKIYMKYIEPSDAGPMVTEVEVGNPTWKFWDDLGDWVTGVERWRFVYRQGYPNMGRFVQPPMRLTSYPIGRGGWEEIAVPARLPDVPPYNHLADCQKGTTP